MPVAPMTDDAIIEELQGAAYAEAVDAGNDVACAALLNAPGAADIVPETVTGLALTKALPLSALKAVDEPTQQYLFSLAALPVVPVANVAEVAPAIAQSLVYSGSRAEALWGPGVVVSVERIGQAFDAVTQRQQKAVDAWRPLKKALYEAELAAIEAKGAAATKEELALAEEKSAAIDRLTDYIAEAAATVDAAEPMQAGGVIRGE